MGGRLAARGAVLGQAELGRTRVGPTGRSGFGRRRLSGGADHVGSGVEVKLRGPADLIFRAHDVAHIGQRHVDFVAPSALDFRLSQALTDRRAYA